ncbi:MAG: glutathione S-transferase family protein [Pseudomonadota bacterium]
MSELKLYFFPRACSGVTMTALEMAGLDYGSEVVNIMKGEQKSPEYLRIHRSGKVPALVVDGVPVTENASILTMLDAMAPDAGILPKTDNPLEKAQQRSDLVWCSSTIHPMVRQIRMPMRFTTEAPFEGIKADGIAKFADVLSEIEERVADGKWFYGDQFSIVDVYLRWLALTAASAGFPLSDFPNTAAYVQRVSQQPAAQRAIAKEAAAVEEAGIVFPS